LYSSQPEREISYKVVKARKKGKYADFKRNFNIAEE